MAIGRQSHTILPLQTTTQVWMCSAATRLLRCVLPNENRCQATAVQPPLWSQAGRKSCTIAPYHRGRQRTKPEKMNAHCPFIPTPLATPNLLQELEQHPQRLSHICRFVGSRTSTTLRASTPTQAPSHNMNMRSRSRTWIPTMFANSTHWKPLPKQALKMAAPSITGRPHGHRSSL